LNDILDTCVGNVNRYEHSICKITTINTSALPNKYNVQISLIMSQQIQSDIFHTKMIQNALWCQIT